MWIVLNLKGYTWFSFQWRDIIHMDLIRWIKKTVNPASNFKQFIICTWPYCPFSLCECLHMLAKSFHTFPVSVNLMNSVFLNLGYCITKRVQVQAQLFPWGIQWTSRMTAVFWWLPIYPDSAFHSHCPLAENIFPHMNSCRTGVGWLSWEAGNQSWTVMTLISLLPAFAGFKLQ